MQKDLDFEEVRWSNLILENGQEGDFSEGAVPRREEEVFFTEVKFLSKNRAWWALLFGLEE